MKINKTRNNHLLSLTFVNGEAKLQNCAPAKTESSHSDIGNSIQITFHIMMEHTFLYI